MRFAPFHACAAIALLLSGCASLSGKPAPEHAFLKPVSFSELPGWTNDDLSAALAPLEKSCARMAGKAPDANFGAGGFAGKAEAWQDVCGKVPPEPRAARAWFEENFTPYALYGAGGAEGLFTGYYEPLLHGSYKKHGRYTVPIYARPADLVDVSLGDFKPELKGMTVAGRVKKGRLVPYYTRAQIEKGAIRGQRKIVWVDSAADAFFLHIQGSGLVEMEGGKTLHVGYAAQNGQPYLAVGRELIKRGALEKDNVSMQSIRAWLETHPDEAPEVMDLNASYVFFRTLGPDGPLGAQGAPLTPGRSLAVDRMKIPYGAPIWLDTADPDGEKLQRLMIAQDTGGAITGVVRGDFFWGAGEEATDKAGRMKSKGRAYILLPKSVAVPEDRQWRWWRDIFKGNKP
jgi:membrane-bound lytic murein transglycosylase A